MNNIELPLRLRRLRRNHTIRNLMQETRLHPSQFIAPLFIKQSLSTKQKILAMPGQWQLSLNCLDTEIPILLSSGIKAVLLFGIPATKNDYGDAACQDDGIIQQAIRHIRAISQEILIITDLCFCEYTNHGHCGILKDDKQELDNDRTLVYLAKQAVSHAKAGADWIAPSAMADGMVKVIRKALDNAGFTHVTILSYAVKYSSSFYGPFRQAAEGTPLFGDRKSYQMNPANGNEAFREAELDLAEGADLLMVKPAMNYLDIIYRLKHKYPQIPLCAYQVSGEYAMIEQAALAKIINREEAILESLLAIKRAGADLIISYFAKDLGKLLIELN